MFADYFPSSMAPPPNSVDNTSAPPRRRVLFLLEDFGGGTGNHISRMVRDWQEKGWSVTIVTQTRPLVRLLPASVDLRVIERKGWYDRFPLTQARRLFALWRLARELRPDVV